MNTLWIIITLKDESLNVSVYKCVCVYGTLYWIDLAVIWQINILFKITLIAIEVTFYAENFHDSHEISENPKFTWAESRATASLSTYYNNVNSELLETVKILVSVWVFIYI